MEKLYVRATNAHKIFDVGRTTFWRWTKEKDFPKIRKRKGVSNYLIQELTEWFDKDIEEQKKVPA